MTDVKICGVSRRRDVEAASEAGASYVGLVFAESPRRVGPEEAAPLARAARAGGLTPVGVFVDRPAAEVRSVAAEVGLPVVQLHGGESPEPCRGLRDTGLEVWKALRPRDPGELAERAAAYAGAADALLVEGHSEEAPGGTGTAVPPGWLEALEGTRGSCRLVLAGGLEPETVAAAIREVRPDVVDVSSGVERRPGEKDPARIREFVSRALSALEGSREAGT